MPAFGSSLGTFFVLIVLAAPLASSVIPHTTSIDASTSLLALASTPSRATRSAPSKRATDARPLPDGSLRLAFENLEGVILLRATLAGASRDTSGLLVLDTGAGFLGLGTEVARALGVFDGPLEPGAIELAPRPLSRLSIAELQIDQVTPLLVLDVRAVKQVTDRAVLGLAGTRLLQGRAVWIDYRRQRLIVAPSPRPGVGGSDAVSQNEGGTDAAPRGSPDGLSFDDAVARSRHALGGLLRKGAIPLRFAIEGDGKILLKAYVGTASPSRRNSWLTFILDTGATKTVLFASALREIPEHREWKTASGLTAPTLLGNADARLTLVPRLTLASFPTEVPGSTASDRATTPSAREAPGRDLPDRESTERDGIPDAGDRDARATALDTATVAHAQIDCIVMESELQDVLARAIEQPVDGLLGYSFLRHYRLGLDFGNRIAWFEPYETAWDPHPFEYIHVGVQLERRASRVVVAGVIEGSPAHRAGVAIGDRVVAVDGASIAKLTVLEVSRRLEGRAGTRVTVTLRRGDTTRTHSLVRRRVL